MADMPDAVPTLAVVAAYAHGRTAIRGVGHLKEKESDRLAAVCVGLHRMGIQAAHDTETLWIRGGTPQRGGDRLPQRPPHRDELCRGRARDPGGRDPGRELRHEILPDLLGRFRNALPVKPGPSGDPTAHKA